MIEQKQKSGTIRRRHSERQRKRARMMKIRRTIFFGVLILITVFVILFYTPIFKIRSVEIIGNNKVETTQISEIIGEAEGKNLFRIKASGIKKNLLKIPYIDGVEIDRKAIGAKLVVNIKECEEAAYLAGGIGYIIIDPSAKVLSEVEEKPQNIPEVMGISMTKISLGEQLQIEEKDKFNVMLSCIEEMKKIDILKGVVNISVADLANITFNYEDRLDALCGSNVDLEKKLGFFKSAINSSKLTENSRGTIDLTTTGKAIYTP